MIFEQRLNDDGKPYVYLNTENIKFIDKEEDVEIFKCFQVTTYDLLKRVEDKEAWGVVFKSANDFLKTLTEEEQKIFIQAYLSMHFDIATYLGVDDMDETQFSINIDKMTELLQTTLGSLDLAIDLVPKLLTFVEQNIPIQDYKEAGTNAPDSPEMTFYRPDVVILTSIVVLSKILSPIFGIIIHYCSKVIDNELKVFHCAIILKKIIEHRYGRIYSKLTNYLMKIIEPTIKQDDILLAYNAYTINMLTESSIAYLLTRRFISVDIYTPDGNLMIYIMACTKSFIKTLNSNTNRKNAVKEKKDPDEIRGDEGNLSRLENESRNSKTTADVPVLIKVTAEYIIDKTKSELDDFELEIYNNTYDFYQHNYILPNIFNRYLLSIYYGNDLCGARGVDFLNIKQYMKLITLLQINLFKLNLFDLILPLSMLKLDSYKVSMSDVEQIIRLNWNSFMEYKICSQLYPHSCGDITWDSVIPSILEFLINNNFIYNTSPEIWRMLQIDNHNAKALKHTEYIFRDIYKLIIHSVSKEESHDDLQQDKFTI